MKKLIALLLAVVMVMGLAACGSKTTTETKAPTEAKVDTPATEAETDAPAAAGSVYYLNFKPEFDQALQGLAASYTEKTGVPVKVVTAASGDYSNTLNAQMGKDGAPTVYNIGNMSGLKDWDEYALDLTGTALAGELATNDFNLYNEAGELKAMGYCYESFGIIVNTKLLADAGHSLDEIKDFASLKAVADDIHARAAELGFDAFSSAGQGKRRCARGYYGKRDKRRNGSFKLHHSFPSEIIWQRSTPSAAFTLPSLFMSAAANSVPLSTASPIIYLHISITSAMSIFPSAFTSPLPGTSLGLTV